MLNFLSNVFWTLVVVAAAVAFFALRGYNALRALSEHIREAWSNIGVSAKKQASLVNQLIDVVKGYEASEKFLMLKVSADTTTAAGVAELHQQTGTVLTSVAGLAQKFPDLKSNQQYQRLIDSIQDCEAQLEAMRERYNAAVRAYNTRRSSIPDVFYAPALGFKAAPYLEFNGTNMTMDVQALQTFSADADGERLNQLLGTAASSVRQFGERAVKAGADVAARTVETGKHLASEIAERRQQSGESPKLEDKSTGNA